MKLSVIICASLVACATSSAPPATGPTVATATSAKQPSPASLEPTPELARRACDAIDKIYAPEGCQVFGETFSVAQCLRDVESIRAEATSEADRHQLGRGLQCATAVASCDDVARCAAEFRAR